MMLVYLILKTREYLCIIESENFSLSYDLAPYPPLSPLFRQ